MPGMSAVTFGFTFALGAAGYMAGAAGAARLVQRLGLDRMMGHGVSLLAAGGSIFAAIVAAPIPNGLWLIVAMAIYLAGLGLAMPKPWPVRSRHFRNAPARRHRCLAWSSRPRAPRPPQPSGPISGNRRGRWPARSLPRAGLFSWFG